MIEFDKQKMKLVMQAFYRVTNARIAVYDEWFNELMGYPENACDLCKLMRKTTVVNEMCKVSDKKAFTEVQNTHETFLYKCKMGLYEAIAPIILNERIIGYIMMGQVYTLEAKKAVEENIKHFVSDSETALSLLDAMQFLSKDKLLSSSYIMMVCIENLCAYKDIRNRKNKKIQLIESYIMENLSVKLSVDNIATRFNMSRACLFSLFKKTYGEGVTAHINRLKIERAKELFNGGITLENVLVEIGISDINYFWRMFKNIAKMTVRDYLFEISQKNYLYKSE